MNKTKCQLYNQESGHERNQAASTDSALNKKKNKKKNWAFQMFVAGKTVGGLDSKQQNSGCFTEEIETCSQPKKTKCVTTEEKTK